VVAAVEDLAAEGKVCDAPKRPSPRQDVDPSSSKKACMELVNDKIGRVEISDPRFIKGFGESHDPEVFQGEVPRLINGFGESRYPEISQGEVPLAGLRGRSMLAKYLGRCLAGQIPGQVLGRQNHTDTPRLGLSILVSMRIPGH
jgi:hypothetical protein